MTSLRVTLFILTIYVRLISSENTEPTVKLKVKENGPLNYTLTKLDEQIEILIENKPFSIIIQSDNGLSNLKCYSSLARHDKIHDGTIEENEKEKYFYVKDKIALPQMGGIWRCAVTIYSKVEVECTFPVHVRRKGVGAIYINNKKKEKLQLTDLFVTKYDEIDYYTFTEGEISEFTCVRNSDDQQNSVTITVNDNKGNKVVVPGYKGKSSILIKLTSQYQGGYLDCKVNVRTYNDSSIIRVNLLGKTLAKGYGRFKINDKFLPEDTTPKGVILYNYEYFDKETVDITTMVDTDVYKQDMYCQSHKANFNITDALQYLLSGQQIKDIRISMVFKKENNNIRISCNIEVKETLKMLDSPIVMAIDFIYYDEENETNFNPAIIGLPRSNILRKFKENHYTGYIYYEYRNKSVLKLKCLSKNKGLSKWQFNNVKSDIITSRQGHLAEERKFKMNDNCIKAEITCRSEHYTTRLVLIREGFTNDILFNNNDSEMDNNFPKESETEVKSKDNAKLASTPEEPNQVNTTIIIVAGVVVAAIIILVVVWMIITIYKRKHEAELIDSSSINYETLPEHSKGSMPVPRQWQSRSRDDPPYCTPVDANLDGMYTKPIPKNLRPRNVSAIYAEVQYAESNLENPYAEFPNLENPYAEIMIEAEKGNFQYANVEFEKQNGIDKKPNNYAEIMNDDGKKDDKYENVFDSQRYGNVHSKKNIVESTYCEM